MNFIGQYPQETIQFSNSFFSFFFFFGLAKTKQKSKAGKRGEKKRKKKKEDLHEMGLKLEEIRQESRSGGFSDLDRPAKTRDVKYVPMAGDMYRWWIRTSLLADKVASSSETDCSA